MKAWRFYGFNNMQLDEIPGLLLHQGHVAAEILCVQLFVAEAQLVVHLSMNKSEIGWKPKRR